MRACERSVAGDSPAGNDAQIRGDALGGVRLLTRLDDAFSCQEGDSSLDSNRGDRCSDERHRDLFD